VAFYINGRKSELRLGLRQLTSRLRQLSLRLVERCLKLARIDFEQNLAFVYERAFAIVLLHQIARYLRLNVRIHVAVRRRHPVAVNRHVLLRHRRDQDLWRRRRLILYIRGCIAAAREEKRRRSDNGEDRSGSTLHHFPPRTLASSRAVSQHDNAILYSRTYSRRSTAGV